MKSRSLLIPALLLALPLSAQDLPEAKAPPQTPASAQPAAPASGQAAPAAANTPAKAPDRSAAYYHYTLAHIYEELATVYGRSEYVSKAVEQYKLALQNDPQSEFLNSELAEFYAKTGRIRDAVLEAQEILKRDPNNLEAHKLLGRIYVRSLGDSQSGQSQEMLKRALEQIREVVRLEPKNTDNYLLLGRLHILAKELDKAEEAFKDALRNDPASEEALTNLAYLYTEQGNFSRAVTTLESVPEAERTGKIYAALGFSYEQQKDYGKAVAAYRKATESDSDNLDWQRGLAQNLFNDGQLKEALEQYQALAEADPQDATTLVRIAEIQRRDGQFDAALESLKKAEALVSNSLEVPYNMALVYQAQGKFDDAVRVYTQLLDRTAKADRNYSESERSNRAVFLERLGDLYRDANQTSKALETFAEMLTLGGETASRGYQQIIETHRTARQWAEALRVAEEAARKFPQDRDLQMQYAAQLADSGKPDEGVARVRGLLKGTPEDREVYLALAQIYSRQRRWKESEEAIAQADKLATTPREKYYAWFMYGSVYERQKKFDQAEEMFKKILSFDPHNAMVLNYLGYMLADRGVRLEEALGYIKEAVARDPASGAYLDSLGWVYFKMGQDVLAEEYLHKAIERLPYDSTVHDHLADLYLKTGRLKEAAAHWERALEEWNRGVPSDADPAEVAKVQKKLEQARVRLAKQVRE
ncbi:MAG TPA: tetratricopeptide repeat protein [Terriglobales bacterium]|nr:tetratricopeptide repeat protein [Terriglobales bacterium]